MVRKRKFFFSLIVTLIGFFGIHQTTFAAEDGIHSIHIDVHLQEDGSAIITEIWDIDNVFDGTEYFIEMDLPESMTIHSLEVWDEFGTQFEILDEWDIDATFEEKANRAGIWENYNRYEICWGISHYGNRTFTIRYVLTNLVQGYSDVAEFYHQFISYDLSSQPASTSITLHMDGVKFSEENADIQFEGFTGTLDFTEAGAIIITSAEGWYVDFANVMAQFDSMLFDSLVFNEGEVGYSEWEGDIFWDNEIYFYEDSSRTFVIPFFIITFAIGGGIIGIILSRINSKIVLADGTKLKKPRLDEVQATQALPFGGSIPATYYALSKVQPLTEAFAFGSYLMKWEYEGIIEIDNVEKKRFTITFDREINTLMGIELSLYNILLLVADEDGVLTSKQFEKWTDGQETIQAWEKQLKEVGKIELRKYGSIAADNYGKDRFTQKGYDQIVKLYGFMKYLREYKGDDKKVGIEREWWGNYLVFATLLGMTKEVKAYYNVNSDEFDPHFMHMYQMMLLIPHINGSIYHHQSSDHSSANFGGGGGGGFSGGGGGMSGGGGGGSR